MAGKTAVLAACAPGLPRDVIANVEAGRGSGTCVRRVAVAAPSDGAVLADTVSGGDESEGPDEGPDGEDGIEAGGTNGPDPEPG